MFYLTKAGNIINLKNLTYAKIKGDKVELNMVDGKILTIGNEEYLRVQGRIFWVKKLITKLFGDPR